MSKTHVAETIDIHAMHKLYFRTQLVCYILLILVLVFILVLSSGILMRIATNDSVMSFEEFSSSTDTNRNFDCILVLGAGLKADGTPSSMLSDRVNTACELYRTGTSNKMLMSGDHTGDYNEVAAMKNQAIGNGISSTDIFLDHEGFSTYESIWRAKEVYGAKRIVIVSQEYHLYRAIYIAEQLGVQVVGVSSDGCVYAGRFSREMREVLARFKDMYYAAGRPTINDTVIPVSLNGDGNLT